MRLCVLHRHDVYFRFPLWRYLFGRQKNAEQAGHDGQDQQPRFGDAPHWGSKPYQSSQGTSGFSCSDGALSP